MQPAAAPYSANTILQDTRDRFLAANGLSVSEYTAPSFTIGVFAWRLKFPNPGSRKLAVPLHDLHHVLTGYGTTWMGEAEIGAWELRAGCNSFITYFLNGGGVLIGLSFRHGASGELFAQPKTSTLSIWTLFPTNACCK